MNAYEYYIKFNDTTPTAGLGTVYLNRIVYVAYTETTEENFVQVNTVEEVNALTWLDEAEKEIIKKGFDNGLTTLYIRGAINEEWGTGDIKPLTTFVLNGVETDISNIAFTMVMSPRWKAQEYPSGFNGILVNSVADVPTKIPAENVVNVYDTYTTEAKDKKEFDGKALGIMALFLSKSTFTNLQFANIVGYNAVPASNLIATLKESKTTFIFNDGINDVLGMFSAGGKAITAPYISELWKYNVRESIRKWMQVKNPTYINDNILIIEDLINKECTKFVNNGYFRDYKKTVAPLVEEQLASDVDNFLVNNVEVQFNTAGAIWEVDINVSEDLL